MRTLTRSRSDRILAGVCAGVAHYFGIDANVVRVLWILSLLLACVGVVPYVAAIFLLPEESEPAGPGPSVARISGFGLLGLGMLFLLRTFDARVLDPTVLAFWKFEALGPVMLAVAGALLVWPRSRAFLGSAGRRPKRSVRNRVLGGVAGGIAAELGLDANVVRLAFLFAGGLTFGLAVLLYLLLILVLPEESLVAAVGAADAGTEGGGPASGGQAANSGGR
jgi:MYXO-CTERM domain-containing protein